MPSRSQETLIGTTIPDGSDRHAIDLQVVDQIITESSVPAYD